MTDAEICAEASSLMFNEDYCVNPRNTERIMCPKEKHWPGWTVNQFWLFSHSSRDFLETLDQRGWKEAYLDMCKALNLSPDVSGRERAETLLMALKMCQPTECNAG
jgi:hypothetical protein